MITSTRQWVSPTAAARHLHMVKSDIDKLIDTGKINAIKKPSGRYMIPIEAIEKYERDAMKKVPANHPTVPVNPRFA